VVSELAWVRAVQPHEHPLAVSRKERGEVVAVCHSSRSTLVGAEAGVETAPAYRGRGLAGEVVLAWATAVRVEGRLPLYSTDWSNLASRAVARKLGLAMYGEDCRVIA
jgi:predicted GNAT family acetyltransferase